MKKLNKKGFTLAELLIVVAIIAVLIAIAIPVFNSSLEKARESTDEANLRAAKAEATVLLLDHVDPAGAAKDYSSEATYYFNSASGKVVATSGEANKCGQGTALKGGSVADKVVLFTDGKNEYTNEDAVSGQYIQVILNESDSDTPVQVKFSAT